MKKLITVLNVLTVLALLKMYDIQKSLQIPTKIIQSQSTEVEKFLMHMAKRESNNIATVVNKFGMLGKYQFDPRTIKMLGFKITSNQFLTNPRLQDSIMLANMRTKNRALSFIINKYDGKIVKGIKVTRSGILAAAHLAGPQNVIDFITNSDWDGRTDANGTSVREYMTTFSRYKIINI